MNIRVVEDDAGFLSLKNDWNRLAEHLTPFQKFDWIYKWWKCFKEGNDLRILVVEENNEIVGIAPLYLKNIRILKYITIKKLSFLGSDVSLYLDFLICRGPVRESVFQSILYYALNSIPFDTLELTDINSHYAHFDLWEKYAGILNMKLNVSYKCPIIKFSGYTSYEEYRKQLSRNHKHSLKFRQNRCKKDNAAIEYVFKKEIREEDVATVGNIHIKRQKFLYEKGHKGRFSHFTDIQKSNFIKDYFCNGGIDSKLLVYMKCNGTVISYYLIVLSNTTIFFWSTGFDNDYEAYAPTKLLINEMVKYAFHNNYECIDFGRGGTPYKYDWANDESVNYDLKQKRSLKAKIVYFYKSIFPEFLKPKKFRLKNIQTSVNSII